MKPAPKPTENIKSNSIAAAYSDVRMRAVGTILLIAYLLIDFLPVQLCKVVDNNGAQWLYLAIVNIVATTVLLISKQDNRGIIFSKISYAFYLFIGFALVAEITAYNRVEGLVALSRWFITLVALLNIGQILLRDAHQARIAIWLVIAGGAMQGLGVLAAIAGGALQPEQITLTLGNKNILAAAIAVKFAIALFSLHVASKYIRLAILACIGIMSAAIYLLAARTAIAGMGLTVAAFAIVSLCSADRKTRLPWVAGAVGVFAAVTLLVQFLGAQKPNGYAVPNITAKMATLPKAFAPTDNSKPGRFTYWSYAADFIKKNALTGGGPGNWKIHTLPYEKWLLADDYVTKHVHNDYLEVAADTGVGGGIAYVLIFAAAIGVAALATIKKHKTTLPLAIPLAGLLAYMLDAAFNFPMERANMQLLLAVALALIAAGTATHDNATQASARTQRFLLPAMLLVAVASLFISWQVFTAMRGQYLINDDMGSNAAPQYTYADIAPYFGTIPNISENGIPIAQIKAKYLIEVNQHNDALKLLQNNEHANPYLPFGNYLIGNILQQAGNNDSAYRYYRMAYLLRPLSATYYSAMQQVCVARKDSAGLMQNFNEYKSHAQIPQTYTDMGIWLMQACEHMGAAINVLQEGEKLFPQNKDIAYNKHHLRAYYLNEHGDYKLSIQEGLEALAIKSAYPTLVNLGLAYASINEYDQSIQYFDKAINEFGSPNGEVEFFRGQVYLVKGDVQRACADLRTAQSKRYPVDDKLLNACR